MELLLAIDEGILIGPSERGGSFEVEIDGVLYSSGSATIHELPGRPLGELLKSDDPREVLRRILADPDKIGLHVLADCAIQLHGQFERDQLVVGFDTFFERSSHN